MTALQGARKALYMIGSAASSLGLGLALVGDAGSGLRVLGLVVGVLGFLLIVAAALLRMWEGDTTGTPGHVAKNSQNVYQSGGPMAVIHSPATPRKPGRSPFIYDPPANPPTPPPTLLETIEDLAEQMHVFLENNPVRFRHMGDSGFGARFGPDLRKLDRLIESQCAPETLRAFRVYCAGNRPEQLGRLVYFLDEMAETMRKRESES